MDYIRHDLGFRKKGEIVEVTLSGSAANVRLMDTSNFNAYKNGRQHRYTGGLAKKSPFNLQIPNTGHWYITVDMNGLSGKVRSSIRLFPAPLPSLQEIPLTSVPSLIRQPSPLNTENISGTYDVFISHASEDKEGVARPLANQLKILGLKVWYDEFELKIGDSLRRKIDYGVASSRIGIVVISSNFIKKGWANYELDGLMTKTVTQEQILLPIWHNISKDEVIAYSPSLADKVARSTSIHTINEIASEILELISSSLN